MSDDAGGGSKTDIWADVGSTIDALDTEMKVSSSSQSSRTAISISDVGTENKPQYTSTVLSGDYSTTQCILNMTKTEIKKAVVEAGLKFNQPFIRTEEAEKVIGDYRIDSSFSRIKLSYFQLDHQTGSDTAYIYSIVNVKELRSAEDRTETGTDFGIYKSVLKCKENPSTGKLDTTLLMLGYMNGNLYSTAYSKYTSNGNQKFKKTLKNENKGDGKGDVTEWDDLTINSNGVISGYSYYKNNKKTDNKYIIVTSDKYSAVKEVHTGEGGNATNIFIFDSVGDTIKIKFYGNEEWLYSFKYLKPKTESDFSNYEIDSENNQYFIKKKTADKRYSVEKNDGNIFYLKEKSYLYSSNPDIVVPDVFVCTVNHLDNIADSSVKDNPDTYMTANEFSSSELEAKLSEWLVIESSTSSSEE